MEVGIRELKTHLSQYVERAAGGEVVTVTDRGQPRALLVPITSRDNIARGLEEGWVTRRSTRPPGPHRPQPPLPDTLDSSQILAEDRGD